MNKFKLLIIFALLLSTDYATHAQSSIVNTPSTDVIDPQSTYVEFNYSGHFGKYSEAGFQTYGLTAVYGLRRNIEVGANLYFTKDGGNSPLELVPNVKWRAYNNEKHKVAVSGGALIYIPLRDEKGSKPSTLVYANASKGFDFAKGFRLTGGVYKIIGAKADSGSKKGVMLGYEQTVYKKITLYADWLSGKNRFAYTGIGVGFPVTKKDYVFAGYNLGNSGRGNNWLTLSYGYYF